VAFYFALMRESQVLAIIQSKAISFLSAITYSAVSILFSPPARIDTLKTLADCHGNHDRHHYPH
jgi:hypothetical protein